MVGEFPELQGVVGRYYAEHDQEPAEISRAIEEHYRPRFAGDALPNGSIGQLLALADKLESIVGIWGIGLAPTGDKDPFAMRRSALGIARLLIEGALPFNLETLVQEAANSFSAVPAVAPPVEDILEFIRERTRVYLRDQGHDAAQIDAVLAVCPNLFHQLPKRLHALAQFMGSAAAPSLSSANKRIGNILKKAEVTPDRVDPKRLHDPAEVTLGGLLKELAPLATAAAAEGNYEKALHALSALKQPVDAFFDQVMVNAEDPALRANRLALLQELHRAMNQVADLSKLAATN
jgi:glycyl-tRNA synthetase beta chain